MINNFTTSIRTKHSEDVVSMRGFTCVFSFGAADAALASGLVPDMNAPYSLPSTGLPSPQMSPSPPPPRSPSPQLSPSPQPESPTPEILQPIKTPPVPVNMQLARHRASVKHWTDLVAEASPDPPISGSPKMENKPRAPHIFDSTPPHLNDARPSHLLDVDFSDVDPKKMDVEARREWLNCLLYYIGTELGISVSFPCTKFKQDTFD